jgi:nucleoside-diphosphate-sugar epimerase
MKIVFAGSTSDTGERVLSRLVNKFGGNSITCIVRSSSDTARIDQLEINKVVGDITDSQTLTSILNPSTTYLDMTHPKYYHLSLEAVINAGVRRAYFVTTTGVFSKYNQFSQIYKDNEKDIKNSGITYTILRPSMIYGSSRDKNMHKLIKFLNRSPAFPLFGGDSLMQPVHVDDLADGIAASIDNTVTENKEYNLAGLEPIAYRNIVKTVEKNLGKNVMKIEIPSTLAANLTRYLQHIPGFPVTEEQVLRLQENKVFDISQAVAELGYTPRNFEKGIKLEMEEMRKEGLI